MWIFHHSDQVCAAFSNFMTEVVEVLKIQINRNIPCVNNREKKKYWKNSFMVIFGSK